MYHDQRNAYHYKSSECEYKHCTDIIYSIDKRLMHGFRKRGIKDEKSLDICGASTMIMEVVEMSGEGIFLYNGIMLIINTNIIL